MRISCLMSVLHQLLTILIIHPLVLVTHFRESQFRPRNFPIFTRSYLRWGGNGGAEGGGRKDGAKISEGTESEPRRLYVRPPTNGIVFYMVLSSPLLSTPLPSRLSLGGPIKPLRMADNTRHANTNPCMTDSTSAKTLIEAEYISSSTGGGRWWYSTTSRTACNFDCVLLEMSSHHS